MNIGELGRATLYLCFVLTLCSTFFSLAAVRRGDSRFATSAHRALLAVSLLLTASAALLMVGLYSRDFSLSYVAAYSSRSTSVFYTFTALWSGMEGSLLFWTFLTGVFAATAVVVQRRRHPELTPIATAVLASLLVFFVGLLATVANPFQVRSPIPGDGNGLNPLLQSPFMAIHPVLLYLGLTGFAVPFAFAVSSLITGRLDSAWFTSTRRWTVVSWSFLTLGILVGGAWAYMELGWGGYWAWDPVENASLLPWLTGTAFLHSVMIQERRQMLKIWNVGLVLATYCLAIFGTFLTRSGLLSSVHTFSESPIGRMFLPFLALMLVGAFGLLGWRYEKLRSSRHLETMFSREAMFLFNNLLLVTIALTVLWGTLYPILVEAISGDKVSVGPPFFNTVIGPMGLALLGLTGIGPLVAWRKGSAQSFKRQCSLPLVAGTATILGVGLNGGASTGAMLCLGLTAFVGTATVLEFVRGANAHRRAGLFGWVRGLSTVVATNRRRYGGYLVHLGVVLMFLGFAGNTFRESWSGSLAPGQTFRLGPYDLRYESLRTYVTAEKTVKMALMTVSRDGEKLVTLRPQRNLHLAQNQPQSEIGLRTSLTDDLYLLLASADATSRVMLRAWLNPLVAWIWIGGGLMALGMLVILSGKPPVASPPYEEKKRVQQRVSVGVKGRFPPRPKSEPSLHRRAHEGTSARQ